MRGSSAAGMEPGYASATTAPPQEPPYSLERSAEYVGFLQIVVRDGSWEERTVPAGDPSARVERLSVTVIGERDTAAYGLTEEATVSREEAVLHVGTDGWLALVREPKLTASAFVLGGGQFEDIVTWGSDLRPSRLAAAVGGELRDLVPTAEAGRLAQALEALGRWPSGILERICAERELLQPEEALEQQQSEEEQWREEANFSSADGGAGPSNVGVGAVRWEAEDCELEVDESGREDITGGDGAAGPALSQVEVVPDAVRILRRRLSRLILLKGASPEARALFGELWQLEQRGGASVVEPPMEDCESRADGWPSQAPMAGTLGGCGMLFAAAMQPPPPNPGLVLEPLRAAAVPVAPHVTGAVSKAAPPQGGGFAFGS